MVTALKSRRRSDSIDIDVTWCVMTDSDARCTLNDAEVILDELQLLSPHSRRVERFEVAEGAFSALLATQDEVADLIELRRTRGLSVKRAARLGGVRPAKLRAVEKGGPATRSWIANVAGELA